MALKKCYECGEKVSTSAKACTSCGAPVKAKTSGCALIVCFLVMTCFVGMMITPSLDTSSAGTSSENVGNRKIESKEKTEVPFQIIHDDAQPPIKRSVTVRLQNRVSTNDLQKVAVEIKSMNRKSFNRTFIEFLLPGWERGGGAWATTHYTPDLEVRILGLSPEDETTLKDWALEFDPDGSSTWLMGLANFAIVLTQKGDGMVLKTGFVDGSGSDYKVAIDPVGTGRKVTFIGKPWFFAKYLIITKEGTLQLWDDDGLIPSKAKRL